MAAPNLAAIRSFAQMQAFDTDRVNPGLSDAQWNLLINDRYQWLQEEGSTRLYTLSHTEAFTNDGAEADAFLTTTVYDLLSLEAAFLQADGDATTGGTPLEWAEPHELFNLQASDTTEGTITKYSAVRLSADPTTTQQGAWQIFWHPLPSGAYFVSLKGRQEVASLSSDADFPDVTYPEGFLIARLAAIEAAHLLGRQAYVVENIMRLVPQDVKARMGLQEKDHAPRARPGEATV